MITEVQIAEAQAKATMMVRKAWEKFQKAYGVSQPPQNGGTPPKVGTNG
jgi:hypothetical protein